MLALGVGAGTLLLGGSLAALVSFYDFPGRRWLDWALVLPLAMPAYVLVFVLLGQYDEASPLQSALRALLGDGFQLPQVRSTVGTILVLTLVLYPYVYILGRGAFLEQSRDTMEAARTLGLSHARAIARVALPLARPALAAGAALAVMEALADFGAVNLLNYRAMTDAIYRVWYGAFDQAAALQLATILLSLSLALIALERLLRGRARYHGALARGEAVVPRRLHGPRAALATALPCVLLALVLVGPVIQLLAWAVESVGEGAGAGDLVRDALTSITLAGIAALLAAATATVIVYGRRTRPSRFGALTSRLGALGYAVPGTVVAVAVYTPLAWLDRRLADGGRELLGLDPGLLFTGTILGLIVAYVVRFQALAFFSVDVAHAARGPGARRRRPLARRRPQPRALRRPPAAAVAGDRHRGAARVRRGHEGAAGDRAAAAAGRRHARRRGLGGHARLALRGRGAARAADRRGRAGARGAGDPLLARRRRDAQSVRTLMAAISDPTWIRGAERPALAA